MIKSKIKINKYDLRPYKILNFFQQWEYHFVYMYIYLNDDEDEIIGSYRIVGHRNPKENDSWKIESLYVTSKFRGRYWAKEFMDNILKEYGDKSIYIKVLKKSAAPDFYREYGFKWNNENKCSSLFRWMRRK